ncbi:MAG TPA: hypothetical protein VNT54_05800, partial [Solirubrobacteraceae bacterium]|nr:hypothetical protein [Solirubrobacteraceae bacterium]
MGASRHDGATACVASDCRGADPPPTPPAAGLDRLSERFDVEVGGLPFDRDWLYAHAPGAAAIIADPT